MRITRQIVVIFFLAGLAPPVFFRLRDLLNGEMGMEAGYWLAFLRTCLISATSTLLISLSVFVVIMWIDRRWPWERSIARRLLADVIFTYPVAIGTTLFLAIVTEWMITLSFQTDFHSYLVTHVLIASVMNTLLVTAVEGIYFFRYWKSALVEQERLEKENIRSQFETLKNQVNPHFLFNSLSILSSLVHDDPEKAEVFIDEFANVYRYVLEVKNRNVIEVKAELDFIHSFLFLHQIRFGANLKAEMNIDSRKLGMLIPPLSLQLLVENAIKHNIISRESPLYIEIYTDGDYIVAKNNFQPKETLGNSTGIGLQNLTERYRILSPIPPEFTLTHDAYIARLPLIKP